MIDLVLISIWAGATTLLISHVLFNTAGGMACAGSECRISFVLLGMSVGQNVLCLMGLVLSAERVADRTSLVAAERGEAGKEMEDIV